jgi:hypothetical protein
MDNAMLTTTLFRLPQELSFRDVHNYMNSVTYHGDDVVEQHKKLNKLNFNT